jgi:hypothetical protein
MIRRILAFLPFLGVLCARGAVAQQPAAVPLVPHTGSPIPYKVQLPEGWGVDHTDAGLIAVHGRTVIGVLALDILEESGNPMPGSESESRRMLTETIVGSDSLLLVLMEKAREGMIRGARAEVSGTPEIRTLGGSRAAFMRASTVAKGAALRMDMYFTLSDGYVVVLFHGAPADSAAQWQPLFDRVRESVVLPHYTETPEAVARAAAARDTSDVFRWVEGRWNWAHRKDPCGDSSFALSAAPDRQSIRLEYKRQPSPKDTARVYTYRVLGHGKDEIQGQIAGQTLPGGTTPISWSFVRLDRDRFCWRRNDWTAPNCTRSLERCVAPQALAPGDAAGTLGLLLADRRRSPSTAASR